MMSKGGRRVTEIQIICGRTKMTTIKKWEFLAPHPPSSNKIIFFIMQLDHPPSSKMLDII